MEATSVRLTPAGAALLIQQLKTFYEDFSAETISQLDTVYTQDIEFRDPVHTLNGSLALKRYLRGMAARLEYYRIRYLDEQIGDQSAYLTWELDYRHRAIKGGALITVRGMSHVKFTSKLYYHEDSYDLGALLYEHLPGLGAVTRRVKKHMGGQQ
jgi:hypothetical protein